MAMVGSWEKEKKEEKNENKQVTSTKCGCYCTTGKDLQKKQQKKKKQVNSKTIWLQINFYKNTCNLDCWIKNSHKQAMKTLTTQTVLSVFIACVGY